MELSSRNLPVEGEEELEHDFFLHETEVLDGGNDAFSVPQQQADLCSGGVMLSQHMAVQLVSGWDRGTWDCRGS